MLSAHGVSACRCSSARAGLQAVMCILHGVTTSSRKSPSAENLRFKLALIHAEQDKAYLKKRFGEGRIKPLHPAPEFNAAVIDRSECIVGMMGAEPWKRALEANADVILAGRSSDTAIFAAMPEMRGFPSGMAWHAAKILECGAAAVVNRKTPDCMFAWIRKDHFVIQAPDPALRCTPQSIASHSLYENADPFKLIECPAHWISPTAAMKRWTNDRSRFRAAPSSG